MAAVLLTTVMAGCTGEQPAAETRHQSGAPGDGKPVEAVDGESVPGDGDELASAQTVSDLSRFCRPEVVATVASTLATQVTPEGIANGNGPAFEGGTLFVPASEQLPAFCQVTGSFVTNPETGKTANFLATFPENWNGKYLQIGCSGHCGQFAVSDPSKPFATISLQGYPYQTITKGYASFATDQGHQDYSGGQWAIVEEGGVDEDAIEDFYYRAGKIMAGMGKDFTTAFYSEALKSAQDIDYSYFSGCSGGGRDAFVAASYFPEEFDGIIGGSAYNLAGVAMHWAGVALAQLESRDAMLTPQQVSLIDPIVKARCDGVDGVVDGLIQNPAACDFRPEVDLPECEGGEATDQCFTPAQINVLSALLTAITDEEGNVVQPAFSVSEILPFFISPATAEDYTSDEPWPDAANSPATAQGGGMWDLPNAVIKTFAHRNAPDFHTRSLFSFTEGGSGDVTGYRAVISRAAVDGILAETARGIGHFPENAQKLIDQDRKFLIWHNLSDEKLTPFISFNYYSQLARLHGGYDKLQDNVRLFSLPGTGHCSMSGIGPTHFDALTAMEEWVEKGKAPNALTAELYHSNAYGMADFSKPPARTMPLCKFPEMARYSGEGDVNDAANWRCPEGDTGMLDVGESGRQAGVVY